MAPVISEKSDLVIRPAQYRDLEAVERLLMESFAADCDRRAEEFAYRLKRLHQWHHPLKLLSLVPGHPQYSARTYVAEQNGQVLGVTQVSPFNCTRSTWRIEHVMDDPSVHEQSIGTQLLRYCFETILEARTWLLEVNINSKRGLALYRQNGFQPLAEITHWSVGAEALQALASREPDLPNLLPIRDADAALLHQLDTAAMPPLVRQVFDRHINDFKSGLWGAVLDRMGQKISQTETVSGYVFEPQRKAAIGYYQVHLCRDGRQSHHGHLTVHPAYTWLYPELLTQMARLTQSAPQAALFLTSADYQPEREACLEQIGAERIDHTLMMSRSVWHKLREARPLSLEGLQLSEVLQGFHQNRKPVPGRISLLPWAGQQMPPTDATSGQPEVEPKKTERSPSQFPPSAPGPNIDHDGSPC
jgi:ribosomal protein S18 acetylase RimI-like enzyme